MSFVVYQSSDWNETNEVKRKLKLNNNFIESVLQTDIALRVGIFFEN